MFELLKPSSRHVIKTAQVSGRISIDALFGLRSDQTLGLRFGIGDGQAVPPALSLCIEARQPDSANRDPSMRRRIR